MFKKTFALLLALLILAVPLALLGCQKGNDDGDSEDNDPLAVPEQALSFTLLENGTWSVSKGGLGYKKEIIIPAEHEGRAVTKIAANGFSGAIAEKITVPDSIVSIGTGAFKNCKNLTALILPDHIKEIPTDAFRGCIYLQSFTVPRDVTVIGDGAFQECTALTSFTVPEGVISLGNNVFYDCNTLASVTLPSTLQAVGTKAFAVIGEETLESPHALEYNVFEGDLYLGNTANPRLVLIQCNTDADAYTVHTSTRIIYDSAFAGLPLSAITLHESISDIGAYAFSSCTNLTGIYIPQMVKTIREYAFYRCRALTSVQGFAGVEVIGDSAFAYCSRLQSITLSNHLRIIGENIFSGTNSLQTTSYQNISYIGSAENPYLLLYRVINKNAGSYTLHPDTKIIYPSAFSYCQLVEEIELPDGITRIGRSAFYGCTQLLAVTLPDSLTVIEDYAFRNCKRFYSMIIPQSVTYIGLGAFAGCSNISAISIPFVGESASGSGSKYFGHIFGANTTSDHLTKLPNNLKTVTVTGGTTIGAAAFSHCKSIETIKLPPSLKVIGSAAFFLDKSIKQVEISDLAAWCSVKISSADANPLTYGAKLLLNGEPISELTIPDGVTEIAAFTFNGCTNITALSMSKDVSKIGESAFQNCTALQKVTLGDGVTVLRTSAFYGCEKLTDIKFSDNLTEIGNSAFRNCKSLKKIVLPSSLTRIDDRAFKGCEKLFSVRFRKVGSWSVSQQPNEDGDAVFLWFPLHNAKLLTEKHVSAYWLRS